MKKIEQQIDEIMSILKIYYNNCDAPVKKLIKINRGNPFRILIATMISLRTRDEVTIESSKKLFEFLKTSKDIVKLNQQDVEKLIYPAGFYKTKAKRIVDVCNILNNKYNGIVPNSIEELVEFDGIGRKTANIVLSDAYGIDAIAVDVHVHRISNRLGLVKTKTPKETEYALQNILLKKYWKHYNKYLVALGQTICKPISPLCKQCPLNEICKKII